MDKWEAFVYCVLTLSVLYVQQVFTSVTIAQILTGLIKVQPMAPAYCAQPTHQIACSAGVIVVSVKYAKLVTDLTLHWLTQAQGHLGLVWYVFNPTA